MPTSLRSSLLPRPGLPLFTALCAAVVSLPAAETSAPGSPANMSSNPFFTASTLPYELPPFDRIANESFAPAFAHGMAEQLKEVEAIASNPAPPTFDNTIVALERTGQPLSRVSRVFFSLTAAHTNETLETLEKDLAPKLAAHRDAILLNGPLFERLQTLLDQRSTLNLNSEQDWLLERYRKDFVRAGARLSDADKTKLKALNAEIATLQATFSQNVLKEVNASAIAVDSRDELSGLPEASIAAAAEAAKKEGLEGKFLVRLVNTTGQPPLASLENRALRERLHRASITRGNRGGEFDNRAVVAQLVRLRAERATLLGYENHAAYVLEDQTAGTVGAVNKLLRELAPPAAANARREAADLQAMIDREGGGFTLAAWDWEFYTEKVRRDRYAFDESELRPYFELNRVLHDGVFFSANRLFGLTFKERTDLPVYHPDVRVFEVFDADGSPLALFLADFYARPSKRGGAWMNSQVIQAKLLGTRPVVGNHLNVPKPPDGEPTLMTFNEVETLFHEFGHALHGMFSDVTYPRFSGTSVPRDFVEYPSQVYEMWMTWPEVLSNYAKHHQTGEPMPEALLAKVRAAEKFNQGFSTTEYLAASLLDQAWHQLKAADVPVDVMAFEAAALERAGMAIPAIPPRYRTTYFSHVFSGGYSAGYYSYIWSEVLDADSVEWFKENGGMTRKNGDHFRKTLLSRGGSADAMTLFRNFRGAEPNIASLLKRRGLDQPPASDRR